MIANYIVLGTNNLEKSIEFYDTLFEGMEITQVASTDRMTFWQGAGFALAVAIPFDEKPATSGNGTMIGFGVDGREEVVRLHRKVLKLGGVCEGTPESRGPRFSAYARDLDGNKLCFYA